MALKQIYYLLFYQDIMKCHYCVSTADMYLKM